MFEPLIKWHAEDKADPEKAPKVGGDNGWMLVVIERPGIVTKYTHTCPYAETFGPPIAFGAGLDLAKGAMLYGASAKEAVEIVAANTSHTGGRIQVVNIAEALGLLKPEGLETAVFALNPYCYRPECQSTLGCLCRKEAAE